MEYEDSKGKVHTREFYHDGFKRKKDARIDDAHIEPSYRAMQPTSLMARLKAGKCEYCGAEENLKMVHVRKLKDLEGKQPWEKLMIARKRKTMAVCECCYRKIHAHK